MVRMFAFFRQLYERHGQLELFDALVEVLVQRSALVLLDLCIGLLIRTTRRG
jgi:hypothetical protein